MTERFIKNQDHYFDNKSGLEWSLETYGPLTWDEAMEKFDGSSGWRISTIEELITLVDFSSNNPATAIPDMLSAYYWSSSPSAGSSDYAWGVNFLYGGVNYYDKTNHNYVRCVRYDKEDQKMTELREIYESEIGEKDFYQTMPILTMKYIEWLEEMVYTLPIEALSFLKKKLNDGNKK